MFTNAVELITTGKYLYNTIYLWENKIKKYITTNGVRRSRIIIISICTEE
jgi:hypothetical protein